MLEGCEGGGEAPGGGMGAQGPVGGLLVLSVLSVPSACKL